MTRQAGFLVLALLPGLALPPSLALAQQPALVPAAGNPNLAVATVKLENGVRAGKIIGSKAYADGGVEVGSIDDLIMTADNKVVMAVVALGGVLGVGSKLVALPYDQVKIDNGKTTLPGTTKDSLNAMPNFTY